MSFHDALRRREFPRTLCEKPASLVPALPDTLRQVYKDVPSLPPVFSKMYAYFRVHLEDGLLALEGTLRIRKISPPMRAVHGIMPGGNYAPRPNVVVTKSAGTRKTFR